MTSPRLLLAVMLVWVVACEAAPSPFFDALYDAISGNGRRSYGYDYNYNGYYPSYAPKPVDISPRQGKSYKEICRVHFPDAIARPGAGGIVCPY